jgi:hypothetical protein
MPIVRVPVCLIHAMHAGCHFNETWFINLQNAIFSILKMPKSSFVPIKPPAIHHNLAPLRKQENTWRVIILLIIFIQKVYKYLRSFIYSINYITSYNKPKSARQIFLKFYDVKKNHHWFLCVCVYIYIFFSYSSSLCSSSVGNGEKLISKSPRLQYIPKHVPPFSTWIYTLSLNGADEG